MSTYFIGDVHGCYNNLRFILDYVKFDPNCDILYLTGDLVSRGPNSLQVLRLIRSFNKNAKTVLGNHDLHLLKTYFELNFNKYKNHFDTILHAPDVDELIYWLCNQPVLLINEDIKVLVTHAGVHPNWNIDQTKIYAQEIKNILTSNHPGLLFRDSINPNELKQININITANKMKQIQSNLNVFTKMRYIKWDGSLDLQCKESPKYAPKNIHPWFDLSKLITPMYNIIFGHWASLQNIQMPIGIYGLDSGCCWGGNLTLLRWEDKKIIHTPCSPPS